MGHQDGDDPPRCQDGEMGRWGDDEETQTIRASDAVMDVHSHAIIGFNMSMTVRLPVLKLHFLLWLSPDLFLLNHCLINVLVKSFLGTPCVNG